MIKLLKNKFLHDEDGSGLIIVLMTLMVLSVLGATLGTITISGYKMSDTNRDSSSAYYIAEAGANMAYEEIHQIVVESYENKTVKTKDNFFTLLNSTIKKELNYKNEFSPQLGQQPEANITVDSKIDGETIVYTINSKANIGNHTRIAQKEAIVNWISKDTGGGGFLPTIPPGTSVVVKNSIDFDNGEISGDIYFDSVTKDTFKLSNAGGISENKSNIYLNPGSSNQVYFGNATSVNKFKNRTKLAVNNINWPSFENLARNFPKFPAFKRLVDKEISRDGNKHMVHDKGHLNITHYVAQGYEYIPEEDLFIESISFNSNRTLKINTKGKRISMVVNHLNLDSGHIELVGDSKVDMYVKELTTGQGSINKGGKPENLTVYHSGGTVDFHNNISFTGSLFTKNATVNISNGGGVNGIILSGGNTVNMSGGTYASPLIIAPFAKVNATNGNFKGSLVANSLYVTGGMNISFQAYDSSKFPFGSPGESNEENETNKDLINTTPTTESR